MSCFEIVELEGQKRPAERRRDLVGGEKCVPGIAERQLVAVTYVFYLEQHPRAQHLLRRRNDDVFSLTLGRRALQTIEHRQRAVEVGHEAQQLDLPFAPVAVVENLNPVQPEYEKLHLRSLSSPRRETGDPPPRRVARGPEPGHRPWGDDIARLPHG